MFGEIAPNVVPISIIWSSLVLLAAVKSEVILTYLGIGILDGSSWGLLIVGASQDLTSCIWWPLAGTVAAMFGLIYSLSPERSGRRAGPDVRFDGPTPVCIRSHEHAPQLTFRSCAAVVNQRPLGPSLSASRQAG